MADVPGDTAPSRGSRYQPGTLKRAGLFALMLLIVLAFVARMLTPSATRSPLEELARRGERQGAETLRLELLELSPVSADPGPAVQRLVSMGFSCVAPSEARGNWACLARLPDRDRRIISIEAAIATEGSVVRQITTRMSIQTPR
jgi:hypothetical protein